MIERKATVELRASQNWEQAYAALLMDGVVRRTAWPASSFYKFVEGTGLVLVYGTADEGRKAVRVETLLPEELSANDWQTMVPFTCEALPEAASTMEVGGVLVVKLPTVAQKPYTPSTPASQTYVAEPIPAAEEAVQHQQEADVAEVDDERPEEVIYGCKFPGAIRAALRGDSLIGREGGPVIGLVHRAPFGDRVLCAVGDDGTTLEAYHASPDDIVAEDWVVARY